jgi:osmotically-inducible protein OsmY
MSAAPPRASGSPGWLISLVAVLIAAALSGCAPMLVASAVGTTVLVATDRRSVGAQADDEAIELKVATRINELYGEKVHAIATSYNGIVLLSGEVPDQGVLSSIGNIAKNTDRVRAVHNELAIGPNTTLEQRAHDSFITSMVKARFVEANKFSATHVKVVTQRGIVYLMGIVTRPEGEAAGQITATTSGVLRVVKLFEYTN